MKTPSLFWPKPEQALEKLLDIFVLHQYGHKKTKEAYGYPPTQKTCKDNQPRA